MRRKLIGMIFLPFVFVCCSRDNIYESLDSPETSTLYAVLEHQISKTKTSLASNSVVWNIGDKISVLSYDKNVLYVLSTGVSSDSATFLGCKLPEADKYYALYPYSNEAFFDGNNISFSLPALQYYTKNSFGDGANPAVSVFANPMEKLQFRNICGVLSLYLKGSGDLLRIEVSGKNGEYLWGNFLLKADDAVGTDYQTFSYSYGGGKTITLDCGSGVPLSSEPTEFNIVVPSGSFSKGLEVTCYLSEGPTDVTRILYSAKDHTIKRSERHVMAVAKISCPVNLENEVVKDFLNYESSHPYLDEDLSYTYVTDYYKESTKYRKDYPAPVEIAWEHNESSSHQFLTVSPYSDFSNPYYDNFEIDNSASKYYIYNLIPGKRYYYKVIADVFGETATLISSNFTTIGRLRMMKIDGVENVRDLGGIPTANGHRIKYGLLFRGAQLNKGETSLITSEGRMSARMAGIKAEMDLRAGESKSYFNYDDFTVEYNIFPGAGAGRYENIATAKGYTNIIELQWVIDKLRENKPVYFHCAGGADRTGTIAFLIEGLLGVSQSHLSIDYELTSFSPVGLRRRNSSTYLFREMCSIIMSIPEEIPGFDDYPTNVTTSLQKRFYNYFYKGIVNDGVTYRINQADLDWFLSTMLE